LGENSARAEQSQHDRVIALRPKAKGKGGASCGTETSNQPPNRVTAWEHASGNSQAREP
jgi:hypothetical protein